MNANPSQCSCRREEADSHDDSTASTSSRRWLHSRPFAFIRGFPCSFILALVFFATSASAQDHSFLTNHNEKINYAFGQDIVATFKEQEFEVDLNAFLAGMKDAVAGKPALTPDQQKAALKELYDLLTARGEVRWKAAAVK